MSTATPTNRDSESPRRHSSVHRSSFIVHRSPPSGLTLVEMMVSLACVILLMLAYTQLFSDVGGRITDARSMIELTNRMRTASHRLRTDLEAHTCDLLPWRDPAGGQGYFEIIEGPLRDTRINDPSTPLIDESQFPLGDTDDVLMFTIRSKEGPFTGKYVDSSGASRTVQSEVAEVVWFLRPTMKADGTTQVDPPTYTLYRRTFLVMPTYQGLPTAITTTLATAPLPTTMAALSFYDNNDISVNSNGTTMRANTLGDLTKRECRYGHTVLSNATNGFPHSVDGRWLVPFGGKYDSTATPTYTVNTSHSRYGEDVVLTNVLAFDVQVWDPTAPLYVPAGSAVAVGPGDNGFNPTTATLLTKPALKSPVGSGNFDSLGAFVDLNWRNANLGTISYVQYPTAASPTAISPFYSGGEITKSKLSASANGNYATYDTWSTHYEHDGIDQDGNGLIDEGTDGFANHHQAGDTTKITNNASDPVSDVVDGVDERETSPPYPVPLRGIKVRIRCYEPDARQVHEVTVVESFVPE